MSIRADVLREIDTEIRRAADGHAARPLFDFEIKGDVEAVDDYKPTPTGAKLHQSNAVLTLARGPLGSGKALHDETPIPTTAGIRRMGDLLVGDEVYGKDGKPTKVLGVYVQGRRRIWRVVFRNEVIEASGDHLWQVRKGYPITYSEQKPKIMTTEEMADYLAANPQHCFWVDMLKQPTVGKRRDFVIPPYSLGALIGDAYLKTQTKLSSADDYIVNRVRQELPDSLSMVKYKSAKYDYGIVCQQPNPNIWSREVRRLGLNKLSYDKFIPKNYLRSSVSQRKDLLRGLMDTDGTIGKKGGYSFSTVSERLAKDVQYLVSSLGGYATVSRKKAAFEVYVVTPFCPFGLPRKAARWSKQPKWRLRRKILIIERTERKEACTCIEVAAKDRLFLCGLSHIPTHNTYAACRHLQGISAGVPLVNGVAKSVGLVIRNTAQQLADTTIRSWLEAWPEGLPCRFTSSDKRFESSFYMAGEDGNTFRVEIEVLFRAFELQKDLRKLLSANLTWFFANEARELPAEVITTAITRTGRFPNNIPQERRRMWGLCDSNSFDKAHELYNLFYAKQERMLEPIKKAISRAGGEQLEIIKAIDWPGGRSKDAENLENLPPGYYEIAAMQNGERWAAIYCDNEFGARVDGDILYSEWGEQHIIDNREPHPDSELYLGIDGGRMSAYALFADEPDGRTVMIDEISFHKEPKSLVAAVPLAARYFDERWSKERWKRGVGGHDPGLSSSWQNDDVKSQDIVSDGLGAYGWKTIKTNTNDPAVRVEAVNARLRENISGVVGFGIMARCKWAIRCMEMYHRRRMNVRTADGSTRYSMSAEKNAESHMAEAIQYGIMRPAAGGRAVLRTRREFTANRVKENVLVAPQDFSPFEGY